MQNAEVNAVRTQYGGKDSRNNAVAPPINALETHRTPSHDAHYEHAQNKRSNISAVGLPSDRQSNEVRTPTTPCGLRERSQTSQCKCHEYGQRMYGDGTAF